MSNDEEVSSVRQRTNIEASGSKESSSSSTEPQVSSDVHAELAEGCTYDGKKFLVPKTADTLQVFTNPKHMNIGTAIALAPIFTMMYLSFVVKVPVYVNIIVFFFFRACYNAGLGYLLDVQSKRNQMTIWYRQLTKDPNTWYAQLVRRLVIGGLPEGKKPEDYPDEFAAWVWYKSIVNASLFNDSTNYCWLAIRCFEVPTEFSLTLVAQWVVAALLFVFNWWAKVDAHRCIGTYCWYWGDFFYRKNVSLTFDGIFELFPHPMYTVGYTAYYAISLVTRSYTVLLVSLVAHVSQLVFLVTVEEPHIKRTYGDSDQPLARDVTALYDPREGLFEHKYRVLGVVDLDPFSAHTWSIIAVAAMTFCFAATVENKAWAVVLAVVWRLAHWVGLGSVLWFQSNHESFTKHHLARGRALYQAFHHWQHIYSLSCVGAFTSFVGCFLRYAMPFSLASLVDVADLARLSVALVLILLSVWTAHSTYTVIGDFGWFYGDFFIPPSKYHHSICYTGIYRFLNNPDAITGYAGLYGLALLSDSWVIFVLALMSQVLNMFFLSCVEIPHMKKLYGSEANPVRKEGPLAVRVKQLLKDTVQPLPVDNAALEDDVRSIKYRAYHEIYKLYQAIAKTRTEANAQTALQQNKAVTTLKCESRVAVGEAVEVQWAADPKHSSRDWIGVYSADTPSHPGRSDGRWIYVPEGASGTLSFNVNMMPQAEGVYEFRYHHENGYDVVASAPVMVTKSTSNSCAVRDAESK